MDLFLAIKTGLRVFSKQKLEFNAEQAQLYKVKSAF